MKLSEFLRRKRFALNLTQAEAAAKMGVMTYYYNKLEKAKIVAPKPRTIRRIAFFCEVSDERVIKMLKNENHE